MDNQSRQEYVKAAVSFLQNVESSVQDKLKFLRDKGLNDVEIDEALSSALVNRRQPQQPWNFIFLLGACFGCYRFYQAYLEYKESRLAEEKTENNSETGAPTFTDILNKVNELKMTIEMQRKDIQSLKTLMLGHDKFAAPPEIPAWQLKDE